MIQRIEKLEILLIDDNDVVQFLHQELLKDVTELYPVHVFFNGEEALDWVVGNRNRDISILAFLDLNMPVMDGWGFLESTNLAHLSANLKVAVVTSSIDENDKSKAFGFPHVFHFVEKPLTAGGIFKILEEISINAEAG